MKGIIIFTKVAQVSKLTARLNKRRGKVILKMFFEFEEILHNKFISEDQNVNKEL